MEHSLIVLTVIVDGGCITAFRWAADMYVPAAFLRMKFIACYLSPDIWTDLFVYNKNVRMSKGKL